MFKNVLITVLASLVVVSAAVPLAVGDNHPALANYTINDNSGGGYHGNWLNVDDYSNKGVVVVHWKRS